MQVPGKLGAPADRAIPPFDSPWYSKCRAAFLAGTKSAMVLSSSTHLALGILAALIAGAAACAPPRTAEERRAAPELRLEGVRFRLFRGDAQSASGTASVVTYLRDTTAMKVTDLAMHLRDRGEEVVVTAPAGEGVVSARTFAASGGLLGIRGADNAATESARFDPTAGSRGLVIGDDPVELWGRGYRLRGNGFSLDPTVREIVLRGGTRLVAGLPGAR